MGKKLLSIAAAAIAAPAGPAAPYHRLPQGGGTLYPAWTGEYWANPKLDGPPAYTKSEERVRFDWEDWRPVLGSRAESVRNFPTDNFSARWTAAFIARFGEEYTFKLISDEGARLKVRPQGGKDWTTLIDAWQPHPRRADTAQMKLAAGGKYDVVIEYYDLAGDAVCELYWSSPSTPEEVLDYTSGTTVREYWPEMNADMNQQGGGSREDFPANAAKQGDIKEVDDNGWPKQDFKYVLQQGWATYPGRHLLRFVGQAQVTIGGAKFIVGGQTPGEKLPKGAGYDPRTNETRAMFDVAEGKVTLTIEAKETRRTPDSPAGSGVTELYVMKPVKKGGDRPHEIGEIANGEVREAFLPAMFWRVQRTGLNDIGKWSERTPPSYARIAGKIWRADMAYEKLFMAANEIGRDLHLCFGGSIDYGFMENLAKLARFGSDGVNPYDKPTKNPVYPPLNPNLRLYLEHGNEMGWSAIQPRQWTKDYDKIRETKQEPEWGALNFDGKIAADAFRGVMRYHAYRTVRMSQAMRKVWGDAAMGDKVRVMLFGQYERDFQNTMPQYLDDYLNNGAGAFVKDPHPASYYLWGSGPAVYYGTTNMWAQIDKLGGPGTGFGQVVFRYTDQILAPADGMAVVPPDPAVDPSIATGGLGKSDIPKEAWTGSRMAFVAGQGALSQDFTVAEPGEYALIMSGAHGQTGDNPLNVFIGKTNVWEKQLLRGDRKPKFGVFNYGTKYVHLAPGTYPVRIEGTKADPAAVAYIDAVHIGSMNDYFGGPNADNFLGAGAATGQTEGRFALVAKLTTAMALNWGLVPVAYEGGTNAGGDWNGGNVFYTHQAKWEHPLSTVADNNWARFWHRCGGFNAMYYYPGFPDNGLPEADTYRPWAAAINRAQGWELEPAEGLPLPATLTCDQPHCQGEPASRWDGWYHPFLKNGYNKGAKLTPGQWKSWIVLAPAARDYALTAKTAGDGTARLAAGDARVVAVGPAGQPLAGKVFLTKGAHAIKVRADAGAVEVQEITLQ